jgi:hypothetical protein
MNLPRRAAEAKEKEKEKEKEKAVFSPNLSHSNLKRVRPKKDYHKRLLVRLKELYYEKRDIH